MTALSSHRGGPFRGRLTGRSRWAAAGASVCECCVPSPSLSFPMYV